MLPFGGFQKVLPVARVAAVGAMQWGGEGSTKDQGESQRHSCRDTSRPGCSWPAGTATCYRNSPWSQG